LTHYSSTLEDLTISRERNRMARELHDTLAHTLSALSVQLETVKAYWDVDPAAAQQTLDKSLAATRSGLQETRRALKSLRASPLDDLGLALALRKMAEEAAARASLKLDLSLPEQLPALSSDVEQCVYRVAQEAIANAAHHANAQTLIVQVLVNAPQVSLLVRDDGLGFNVEQGETSRHFGLPGMRERAQLVGGQLTIDSQPGQGTAIQLTIEG
jgi:signal transduction histidine kinase